MTARRNPPVDTGPSSPSDNCVNSPVGVTNEPARESGSLHWWPAREMALRGVATACYGPPQPFFRTWIRLSSWTRRPDVSPSRLDRHGTTSGMSLSAACWIPTARVSLRFDWKCAPAVCGSKRITYPRFLMRSGRSGTQGRKKLHREFCLREPATLAKAHQMAESVTEIEEGRRKIIDDAASGNGGLAKVMEALARRLDKLEATRERPSRLQLARRTMECFQDRRLLAMTELQARQSPSLTVLPDPDVSEPETLSGDELDHTSLQSYSSSDEEVIDEDDASANAYRTPELLSRITFETNCKANQCLHSTLAATEAEIEVFTGMLFVMGITKMPRYRMYSANQTRVDAVANCMSRNRFETLLRFLYFNDDDEVIMDRNYPMYDRFYKVRPLLENIRKTCLEETPGELQSVDEHIIPFKGRCKMKCGKNGFVHDFWLCDRMAPKVENPVGYFGMNVVMKRLRGCPLIPLNALKEEAEVPWTFVVPTTISFALLSGLTTGNNRQRIQPVHGRCGFDRYVDLIVQNRPQVPKMVQTSIFWAIHVSLTNSWLKYKDDCTKNGSATRNVMDLMEFMLSVSDSLMKFEKTYVTRKRGRRPSEPTAEEEVGPSRFIRRTIQPEHNTCTNFFDQFVKVIDWQAREMTMTGGSRKVPLDGLEGRDPRRTTVIWERANALWLTERSVLHGVSGPYAAISGGTRKPSRTVRLASGERALFSTALRPKGPPRFRPPFPAGCGCQRGRHWGRAIAARGAEPAGGNRVRQPLARLGGEGLLRDEEGGASFLLGYPPLLTASVRQEVHSPDRPQLLEVADELPQIRGAGCPLVETSGVVRFQCSPSTEVRTAATALVNGIFCRYGAPETLHSDQGRNFESELVNWDAHLDRVLLAYRSGVHRKTGATPIRIVFGRELRLLVNLVYGLPRNVPEGSVGEYTQRLRQDLEQLYEAVRRRADRELRRQQFWRHREAHGPVYKPGDWVWKQVRTKTKLEAYWDDSYEVQKKLDWNTYWVEKTTVGGTLRPPETISRPAAERRDVGSRAQKEEHAPTNVVARFHMPRGR
ncbi:PiggyBac transposable element-derived protein 3 [Trichinella spiralis]|uniref:PiggyBac transposable element-derived protein 3 n=1 Tax=Trichinella spiralis TaxID=6334 RepID=A0A0V1BU60_TRISP|nr:PiggyBac transposable element-derived protein 3 [Trichinella spiralis]